MPKSLAALFVFAFCLVMIASSRGMGETFAIFLLPLSETFNWNRAHVTSIYAIYMVSFGFGSLLSGLVFDRFGPRFNYMIGVVTNMGGFAPMFGMFGTTAGVVLVLQNKLTCSGNHYSICFVVSSLFKISPATSHLVTK